MGKKGSKRKTRWRTLSIGAPPGEEDEEDGLRNRYTKGQENDASTHGFNRNVQSGYKPRRSGNHVDFETRSHKDESSGSPSQPKVIFNEDEYTRITTPRQDMLFKKGYLSRKKPWAGNAITSATSSTTESQSASHSTADGSETTEDQQLLDRDYASGEYPPMMEPGPQLGYGTFYDHANGYYYEYPVMLVGPAPVPAQVAPGVLTAVPCGPVPLRPIEWINPTFVPKLAGQPYYMMDYEENQTAESTVVIEDLEKVALPVENANGTCNESGTGSASYNGSVAGEVEEQATSETNVAKDEQHAEEQNDERIGEQYASEQYAEEQHLENGMNDGPYLEPVLMQQPVHVSHVIPAVPQPYMYPGHYMFGPPLINVNGVTIQGAPMIRTTDVGAMSAACAKRRKKKKRMKQRRLATGNTEDEEEGEYSSECDTGLPSSRLSWTGCSTSTTTTTTTSNRPLNPECQEFKLRQMAESNSSPTVCPITVNTPLSEESSAMNQSSTLSSDATSVDNENNEVCNGVVSDDSKNQKENELIANNNSDKAGSSSLEKSQSTSPDATDPCNESNRLTNRLAEEEEATRSTNKVVSDATFEIEKSQSSTNDNETANDSSNANELLERSSNKMNGIEEVTLVNGKVDFDSNNEDTPRQTSTSRPSSPCNDERVRSRSITPKIGPMENGGIRDENHALLSSNKSSSTSLPKRKYSAKGAKFVREPTPGPDLDSTAEPESETKVPLNDLSQSLEKINLFNDAKIDSMFQRCNDKTEEDKTSNKYASENACNHSSKEHPIEVSNEDSGFESQTQLSDYPITEAVTEWLRRVNSPDIFITSNVSVESETEDDDDSNEEPPKNLHGNPMPALSANDDVADNKVLSGVANCSEFARISNVKVQDQPEITNGGSRKKKDGKKRSGERRRVRHTNGGLDQEVVSSSDSCGQTDVTVNNNVRRKNPSRQHDTVDDVCEFTEKDSVAGMRVASNSRMDSKRVNARRTKRQGRNGRESTTNIDAKIRRIEDVDDEKDDENDEDRIVDDAMNVKTFEKGEIVVSEEGKLLKTSVYEPTLRIRHDASTVIKVIDKNETAIKETTTRNTEDKKNSDNGENDNRSAIISLDNIEEPDVLECWEAETIEPVITPKKMLQGEGILCEGEAAEDDTVKIEQVNIDYVQKYYRLARESATSIEEEMSGSKMDVDLSASSKSLPNKSLADEIRTARNDDLVRDNNVPIDEAFEVYESCYNGKTPIVDMNPKVLKSRTLYGQEGEHPIPCRAACCHIQ